MTPQGAIPPPTTIERAAWCAFDFANSAFTTIVVTAVYPLVFVAMAETRPRGEIAWAWALAASQLVAVALSPVIGALADHRARKKAYLAVTWVCCVVACAALSLIVRGPIAWAWILFVAANVAFSLGENLVAAFLPELAPQDRMGRLSGIGWAVGYFGGLASLAIARVLADAGAVRWVPVATAAFFLAGGLPTFLLLRERATPRSDGARAVAAALRRVAATWRERASFPDLFRLLRALFLAQAGVATVIGFSAIYAGSEFGMKDDAIIELFIGLQLAAAVGAAAFGLLQDRIGGKPALLGTLALWIVAVLTCLLTTSASVFSVGAVVAGAAMGSTQASGRALVGAFTPPDREGEFFGLWGFVMKAASVAGPLAFALLREGTSIRGAMASTAAFFVLGALVLAPLDELRGLRAAGRTA